MHSFTSTQKLHSVLKPKWHFTDIKTLSIVFLLTLLTSGVEGQQVLDTVAFKVYYKLTYQYDSTDINSQRTETMILLIGSNSSVFFSHTYYYIDSISNYLTPTSLAKFDIQQFPSSNFYFRVYKNYPLGQITVTNFIPSDRFAYIEKANPINWKLNSTSHPDHNPSASSAFAQHGGRTWEAWFDRTIPLAEGPYIFKGLPGIITKLKDEKGHYTFELISVEETANVEFITFPQSRFIQTTKAEFFRYRDDFFRNYRPGTINEIDPLSQQSLQANLKRNNNPIELTPE